MELQYHLTRGLTRNLLIDLREEKIYFLPPELDQLDKIGADYFPYPRQDWVEVETETYPRQWIQFLEVDYHPDTESQVLQLAHHAFCDYLLFHLESAPELQSLFHRLSALRNQGKLALRQIYLVPHFDFDWQTLEPDSTSLIRIVPWEQVAEKRKIRLAYFQVQQSLVLQAASRNLFYDQRLAIDREGYLKPHLNDTLKSFPLSEYSQNAASLVQFPELTRLWMVSKNQVLGCQNCEFRDLCQDPDPLEALGDGQYQKTQPCDYEPLTATWQEALPTP